MLYRPKFMPVHAQDCGLFVGYSAAAPLGCPIYTYIQATLTSSGTAWTVLNAECSSPSCLIIRYQLCVCLVIIGTQMW